jgi:uncharacterized protein YjcR
VTRRERDRANAHALRANGLSIREVAERLGVPASTVGDWLRGRGEWYTVRECRLCGERFIPANGRQRFCTPAHQRKHYDVYGPPRTIEGYRERLRALEAELSQLRAQLNAREAT